MSKTTVLRLLFFASLVRNCSSICKTEERSLSFVAYVRFTSVSIYRRKIIVVRAREKIVKRLRERERKRDKEKDCKMGEKDL